jgi:hypothetical protein
MAQSATFTERKRCNKRWTGLNILLMVIGFVLFWPLGLAMLAWIVWGDEISRTADDLKSRFGTFSRSAPMRSYSAYGGAYTGNVAFDEYRNRELKRLEEERRKIEEMRSEFEDFLREARRAKDQDEFEKFMSAFEKRASKSEKSGKNKND